MWSLNSPPLPLSLCSRAQEWGATAASVWIPTTKDQPLLLNSKNRFPLSSTGHVFLIQLFVCFLNMRRRCGKSLQWEIGCEIVSHSLWIICLFLPEVDPRRSWLEDGVQPFKYGSLKANRTTVSQTLTRICCAKTQQKQEIWSFCSWVVYSMPGTDGTYNRLHLSSCFTIQKCLSESSSEEFGWSSIRVPHGWARL